MHLLSRNITKAVGTKAPIEPTVDAINNKAQEVTRAVIEIKASMMSKGQDDTKASIETGVNSTDQVQTTCTEPLNYLASVNKGQETIVAPGTVLQETIKSEELSLDKDVAKTKDPKEKVVTFEPKIEKARGVTGAPLITEPSTVEAPVETPEFKGTNVFTSGILDVDPQQFSSHFLRYTRGAPKKTHHQLNCLALRIC